MTRSFRTFYVPVEPQRLRCILGGTSFSSCEVNNPIWALQRAINVAADETRCTQLNGHPMDRLLGCAASGSVRDDAEPKPALQCS